MPAIDVTYGNIGQAQADRMVAGADLARRRPYYDAGATEPYIAELLCSLLKATGVPHALETGSFLGTTAIELAHALDRMGGGSLTICELDPERAAAIHDALEVERAVLPVEITVLAQDAIQVIDRLPAGRLGLAFVDDDHTAAHVAEELVALIPKMAPGGIIAFHDVFGVCDLQRVVRSYGGFALDFPRCGPAGGLGLLQVPR